MNPSTLAILLSSLLQTSFCRIIQTQWEHVRFKTVAPARVDVRDSGHLVLTCSATGSPAPTLAWYKDDLFVAHLEDDQDKAKTSLGETVARLTLPCVSAKDVGQYECRATAGRQQVSAVTQVNVVSWDTNLCQQPRGRPEVVMWRPTVMVETGNSIVLPCRVSPGTVASVTWTDSNGDHVSASGDTRHVLLASGDLMIHHVSWDDMGEYTCTVANDDGADSVKSFLYPLATDQSRE